MPTTLAIKGLIGEGKEFPVPVEAVSNGVDLSSFRPGRVLSEFYSKYGIMHDVPVVLYVGRVDPEKKVELVVEAFRRAHQMIPAMQLVIVGDGVDRRRLEDKYAGVSEVKFLGKVLPPDLYEIYKIGSVFVTASEIETQGIVLIEAAASGLPLIAVDKGAVGEVCINNKNGYLCRPGDVDEISDAIVKILSNLERRKEFAQKSIEIAGEHDFEKTLDQFIEIYGQVSRK